MRISDWSSDVCSSDLLMIAPLPEHWHVVAELGSDLAGPWPSGHDHQVEGPRCTVVATDFPAAAGSKRHIRNAHRQERAAALRKELEVVRGQSEWLGSRAGVLKQQAFRHARRPARWAERQGGKEGVGSGRDRV